MQKVSIEELHDLINNYSGTVLFLIMEYLHKTLMGFSEPKELFMALNDSVSKWFSHSATLIRKDHKQL